MGVDGNITADGRIATSIRQDNTATPLRRVSLPGSAGECAGPAVAILDVDGLIVDQNRRGMQSHGENPVALFREKVAAIAADPTIAAVVLRINTPGGGVAATDMMAHELDRLRDQRNLPVVACLMTTACGGGYYLAAGTDQIIAHPTSVVGGIGVILNLYNLQDTLAQYNVVPVPVKAGAKVNAGSPERPMSETELELLQRIADGFHDRFIDRVVATRGEIQVADSDDEEGDEEDEARTGVFDGRVVSGTEAVELNLADRVGYIDDAIATARQLAGVGEDGPVVMLRRDNDRALSAYEITPNAPGASLLPISVPGLERAAMPTYLYIWQPEPTFASGG